jgi:malate dehydrogenase (oxaloacetate-decarboxylating)
MATSEALHDRFQRNTPFLVMFTVQKDADPAGDLLTQVRKQGARLSNVELVEMLEDGSLHEMTVYTTGDEQMKAVQTAMEKIPGVTVVEVIDLAMEAHRGGSCEMRSRAPIESNTDLRITYTPGVARVCKAIEKDPSLAREYTNIANKVAIATNGTAILGLGDIGPVAGLPVMEGKSAIFWEFAEISAEPILIDTHDADEFINIMEKLACGFGAIQIEDVKAPECFRITRELDAKLPIPVFHDDQHGTATVVLAGLYSALKQTGKDLTKLRCVINGAGAAGTAIADLLMHAGMPDAILCDRAGIIYDGRTENMNEEKEALARRTNRKKLSGSLADAMKGADLFIGVSQPNVVSKEMVRSMAKDPILFALSNPVSEISREDALAGGAAIYADGRTMNNALAYPGIFRGALDSQARSITLEMMMAAADALAALVPEGSLMPEMMDPDTHQAVADAVMDAAENA